MPANLLGRACLWVEKKLNFQVPRTNRKGSEPVNLQVYSNPPKCELILETWLIFYFFMLLLRAYFFVAQTPAFF